MCPYPLNVCPLWTPSRTQNNNNNCRASFRRRLGLIRLSSSIQSVSILSFHWTRDGPRMSSDPIYTRMWCMLYLTVNCELSSMIRETPHERRRDPTIVEQTKTNKILAWINNDSYVLSLRTYTVVEPSLYTNTPPDRHGIANLSIRPRNTWM